MNLLRRLDNGNSEEESPPQQPELDKELVTMTTQCIHPGEVHSDDLVEVWHGAPEPVYGCGYHATYFADQLMAAHYAQPSCPNECAGTVSGPVEGLHTCAPCGLEWMPEGEDWS